MLQVFLAGRAGAARIYHAAHADQIADLVFGNFVANGGDLADDFMARHQRVSREAPVIARLVDVGVTDTAIQHFDRDVVRSRCATVERHGRQWGLGILGGITDSVISNSGHENLAKR